MKLACPLITTLSILPLLTLAAATHTVDQRNTTFSVPRLKARVGDTVTFNNHDAYVHNIFSLSETQSFDLGTFRGGEQRHLKLTQPGLVEVECAVHPQMKMTIEVTR